MRLPTALQREYYGSGGVDGAISLAGTHRSGPIYLYTTLGYGVYGSGSLFDIELRPYQWTFFAAVEYPVSKKISLIAQQLSNSGVAAAFEGFADPTHELILGVKHVVSPHLMLEYGIVENLLNFRNSVDFGLIFGLRYSL